MVNTSDLRAEFAKLGLTSRRVAGLFAVEQRQARRWRDGSRRIPSGVQIVLRLLASGVVTIEQLEAAARVDGEEQPAEPDPAVPVDPASTASKVISLPRGACRWPHGDPADPDFRFCCAPIADGGLYPYCADHQVLAVRPRVFRAALRLDRVISAKPVELDAEDSSLVAHAGAGHHLGTIPAALAG